MKTYMELAIQEAEMGFLKGEGGPFGAVVVCEGQVIGAGHNEVLTSKDPTAHAEIVAIRRASAYLNRFDLSDCILYTTCEPCPMCYSAIHWARIPQVIYGATREDAAAVGFDDQLLYDILSGEKAPVIQMTQTSVEACQNVFKQFDQMIDKKLY